MFDFTPADMRALIVIVAVLAIASTSFLVWLAWREITRAKSKRQERSNDD